MAIRIVEESPTIKTAADAERFVFHDSGGVVFPIATRRIEGGFEVECFSSDGRPRSMVRSDSQVPASSLPDLAVIETVGWEPYFSKPKDAGKL